MTQTSISPQSQEASRSQCTPNCADAAQAPARPLQAPVAAPGMRERILTAAIGVFLECGYDGTSMGRVADASGAARRTLYNHFDSKEGLFDAMVERIWTSFPVFSITRDGESLRDPRIGLTRLGHAIANFWSSDDAVAFLRMVISEGTKVPALTKTFVDKGKAPAMDAVVEYLNALVQRRLVSIDNPRLASRQFLGLIDESLLWVRVVGIDETYAPAEHRQIVEDAVSMFIGFYGVKC